MDQKQTQGQQKPGPDAPQPGQQNWNERQTPDPNPDPPEETRQLPRNQPTTERGGGNDGDEIEEQEDLPERETDQSER